MKRDVSIDILKGIGIVLVVVGHAGCPQLLHDYIYTFHMPLFFIASGYFFSENNICEKQLFVKKKFRGLYVPFILCSLIFLLLHNSLLNWGLLNGESCTINGQVVNYPFSTRTIIHHALYIIFQMNCYEGTLLGAFWFLRALLLSSLLLCFGVWLCNKIFSNFQKSLLSVSVFCVLCGGMLKYTHYAIPYVPQGGYSELMGVFFMGFGYMIRRYQHLLTTNRISLWLFLLVSISLFIIHPSSMEARSTLLDWMFVPYAGISGTCLILCLSKFLSSKRYAVMLSYIGRKSIWILSLHFLLFKISEYLEIKIYHLPYEMIGCHPVIPPLDIYFWIIHTFTAVFISILLAFLYNKAKAKDFY